MADQQSGSNMSQQQPKPLQMGAKGAYIVRLLMVGDSACGKTSLVLRFDQNVFSTKFVTTIGVDYRDKMVKVRRGAARIFRNSGGSCRPTLAPISILTVPILLSPSHYFIDRGGAHAAATLGHCGAGAFS